MVLEADDAEVERRGATRAGRGRLVDPLVAAAVDVVDVEAAGPVGGKAIVNSPRWSTSSSRAGTMTRLRRSRVQALDVAAHDLADPPRALGDDHRVLRVRRAGDVDRLAEVADRYQGQKDGVTAGACAAQSAAAALFALLAVPARASLCPAVHVPGAQMQVEACLDDLTTEGTATNGHTDPSDWAGLNSPASRNPTRRAGRAGRRLLPRHVDLQHEPRLEPRLAVRASGCPEHWNGKLVVTGAPGIRKQYAADYVIGDFAVARGYAYASTDKGNDGTTFYQDGDEARRRARGVEPRA